MQDVQILYAVTAVVVLALVVWVGVVLVRAPRAPDFALAHGKKDDGGGNPKPSEPSAPSENA